MSSQDAAEPAPRQTNDEVPAGLFDALAVDGCVVARLSRPRASNPTTIAVVADPHVATEATGTWKLYHRTRERFRATLREIAAQDVDALVLAGDLTKDGERDDLEWMAAALRDCDVPSLVVPGNHDVESASLSAFERRLAADGFPVTCRVGDVDLVGLNSAATSAASEGEGIDGVVSDDQLEWLEETLPDANEPIVVTHHNLPGVADTMGESEWAPHPPVGNAEALLSVLDRHAVPLHLSGHVHVLSLSVERGVRGLVAPALSSFPQSYLVLEVDESGTTVRCRTPADVDGFVEAYWAARSGPSRSKAVSDVNSALLADRPLADERRTD